VISSGSAGTDSTQGSSCWNSNAGTNNIDVYIPSNRAYLIDGDIVYNLGGSVFNGYNGYYSDGISYGRINFSGQYTQNDYCSGGQIPQP